MTEQGWPRTAAGTGPEHGDTAVGLHPAHPTEQAATATDHGGHRSRARRHGGRTATSTPTEQGRYRAGPPATDRGGHRYRAQRHGGVGPQPAQIRGTAGTDAARTRCNAGQNGVLTGDRPQARDRCGTHRRHPLLGGNLAPAPASRAPVADGDPVLRERAPTRSRRARAAGSVGRRGRDTRRDRRETHPGSPRGRAAHPQSPSDAPPRTRPPRRACRAAMNAAEDKTAYDGSIGSAGGLPEKAKGRLTAALRSR